MTREAIVIDVATGRPCLDIDPMDVPGAAAAGPLIECARLASIESGTPYVVVWSDTGEKILA